MDYHLTVLFILNFDHISILDLYLIIAIHFRFKIVQFHFPSFHYLYFASLIVHSNFKVNINTFDKT